MSFTGGKKSRRKSARRSSKRSSKSSSRKSARRQTKNPWIAFTKKHRASVIAKLTKSKKYPEGKKGALKLQQDALREMSAMYHAKKH